MGDVSKYTLIIYMYANVCMLVCLTICLYGYTCMYVYVSDKYCMYACKGVFVIVIVLSEFCMHGNVVCCFTCLFMYVHLFLYSLC